MIYNLFIVFNGISLSVLLSKHKWPPLAGALTGKQSLSADVTLIWKNVMLLEYLVGLQVPIRLTRGQCSSYRRVSLGGTVLLAGST